MSRDLMPQTTDQSLALRAFDILRRRRALALGVFATVLAAAAAFALSLPDLYRATAMVLVERQIAESFVRPAVSGELESRLHVIKQEIVSRDRLTELVNRFGLYPEMRGKASSEEVLEQARRDIGIDQSGPELVTGRTKTVTFRVSYTSPSREHVADVTNAIAAFYVAQNDQIRSQEATSTTEFLKTQLAEAKRNLDRTEAGMMAYMSRHSGELPQQVEVNLGALERANTQLRLNSERQIRTLDQRQKLIGEGEIAEAAAIAKTPEAELPPDQRLEQKKKDLASLETKFRDKHPDVQRLKAEIAALEREDAEQRIAEAKPKPVEVPTPAPTRSAQVRRAQVDTIDAEIEKLKKEELDLRAYIGGIEKRLDVVPERQQEFALISRDHNAAKDNYDTLMKRYSEAQLAESMETDRQGERFRVLETAVVPEGPAAPNRPQLLILSVILSVFTAVLALLAAEQIDTTFHSVDDVREFTNVPVLVAIPAIQTGTGRRALKLAMATACVCALVAGVATLSAHFARGNEDIVRILSRV